MLESQSQLPQFRLSLRPHFEDGIAQYIDVGLRFGSDFAYYIENVSKQRSQYSRFHVNDTGFQSPSIRNSSDQSDSRRPLDSDGAETFASQSNIGNTNQYRRHYRVYPRKVNHRTPCGPQVDLEQDGGGLSAMGGQLLRMPNRHAAEELHDICIEWNLESAPSNTRCVCSFGDGTRVSFIGRPNELKPMFFMVGQIHSFPASPTDQSQALYWLSTPNFDAVALGHQLSKLVPKMQSFFEDPNRKFKVFCRRNEYKCVSGMGMTQGFAFGWNDIYPRDPRSMLSFLVHEITHNWPRIGIVGSTPTPEEYRDGWFNEGIAEYYALFLPYRFGIEELDILIHKFNTQASGYYTNPARRTKNSEVMDRFWDDNHVNRIPYQRGLMYFMNLACQLDKAKKRSLDDLVLEMVKLRRLDKPYTIKVWLSLVTRELGSGAIDDYNRMSNAELICLPPDCMTILVGPESSDSELERQDQEEFDLGFSEQSFKRDERKVEGLDPDSRAAKAGVCEGDAITDRYSYFFDAEQWDQEFSMQVLRDGIVHEFRWWARSYEKVESYQLVFSNA